MKRCAMPDAAVAMAAGAALLILAMWLTTSVAWAEMAPEMAGQSGCSLDRLGLTPLTDMESEHYKGEPGGLYPDGGNRPTGDFAAHGATLAAKVVPLDREGRTDPTGRIVLLSLGMSNTNLEFSAFQSLVAATGETNPALLLVNGSQGGNDVTKWVAPPSGARDTWEVVTERLQRAGVTARQVQVVWLKQGLSGNARYGPFPAHARAYADYLEEMLERAEAAFPNLKLVYLSSRTRAYTTDERTLSPEPFAYELGFATRWVIEARMTQAGGPWVAWGPYIWADGPRPNAEGFAWACGDVRSLPEGGNGADFTHPSAAAGAPKVGQALLEFFMTAPTARLWFLRSP